MSEDPAECTCTVDCSLYGSDDGVCDCSCRAHGEDHADRGEEWCMCDWEDGCSGTGVLHCAGCGGDNCVCVCGGESSCDGCEACGFGGGEGGDAD